MSKIQMEMIVFFTLMIAAAVTGFSLEKTRRSADNSELTKNDRNVEKCKIETFMKEFVKNNKQMKKADYSMLQNCTSQQSQCNSYVGTMSVSYLEDSDGVLMILFEVFHIIKQGCWGYALQLTDNIETKTIYFNFEGNKTKGYKKYVYLRLGFDYTFTVTPLPTGKSSTLFTQAPTPCELEVLNEIYFRLERKEIFVGCTLPTYEARRKTAEKICKRHPENGEKRIKSTRNQLIEEKCKFVLLDDNEIEIQTRN